MVCPKDSNQELATLEQGLVDPAESCEGPPRSSGTSSSRQATSIKTMRWASLAQGAMLALFTHSLIVAGRTKMIAVVDDCRGSRSFELFLLLLFTLLNYATVVFLVTRMVRRSCRCVLEQHALVDSSSSLIVQSLDDPDSLVVEILEKFFVVDVFLRFVTGFCCMGSLLMLFD